MENKIEGKTPYSKLFNHAFEAVVVLNCNSKVIYWNPVFSKQFNISNSDFKESSFSNLFSTKNSFKHIIEQTEKKAVYSTKALLKSNKQVQLNAVFDSVYNTIIIYVKEEAKSPDDAKGELNSCALIEEAADSFFIISKEIKITEVNISACKLTGYDKEELIQMDYTALFSEKELSEKPFDTKGIEAGKTIVFERTITPKNGGLINIEMRTKKISSGHYLSIVRDISSRIKIRTQLKSKNNELEEAYQKIAQSESRYKQLFKNIPLGIFTATEDGTVESINVQMLEMLGSDSVEQSMKFNLFELPTLKNTQILEDFKSALQNRKSHYKLYEYTSVWNKKSYLKAHIIPHEGDAFKKILVIVEDYSKEKDKETRLRILSQGVNNSPASIMVTDAKARIRFVNKSFVQITGYTFEELYNKTPVIIKSDHHSEQFYEDLWNTIRSGKEWIGEFKNKKKNGEIFWESAMISALKDEKGQITHYMAIKEDITDRKKVEKELKEKTDQLLNLVSYTPDYICFKDENGAWILANRITLQLFGLENVEYQGKTNDQLIWECVRVPDFLLDDEKTDTEAWEQGSLYQYETSFNDKEGSSMLLEMLKLPLFHSNGHPKGMISIGRDITKRKMYEKELTVAKEKAEESDILKSAFLANMSHEIRTPLNAIMGFSGLMADYKLDEKAISRFVEIIQVNGKQLLTIIDDILLVAKLQVSQIKVTEAIFDIDQICNKLYQYYNKELGILSQKNVVLSIDKLNIKSSVKIKTDRDKLYLIFKKLIRNAIKFTSTGSIRFGLELKGGNEILFFVKDTGVGISKEKQEIVFKKFRQADDSTTREYGGTGLGLSIVKGLIDLLKGDIWVESEEGIGTSFYFTLPIELVEVEGLVEDVVETKTNWKGKKVLIVDDVNESIFLLSEMLKGTGIDIIEAVTGLEAIEKFKQNPDIDIILMDIQLPGLNGLEAAVEIKKINPKVPIVVQTAFGNDDYEEKSKGLGCDDIIFKPILYDSLILKMNKYLR